VVGKHPKAAIQVINYGEAATNPKQALSFVEDPWQIVEFVTRAPGEKIVQFNNFLKV